ncbi:hypothetical protein RXV95_11810 [Novosphingobium sp. ZN18A2]|uniref:hypothetical protein n=1 Tax=Novosphingobium sp. ZN18A2 TaxID=3079861 RepID=UPI0030CE2424
MNLFTEGKDPWHEALRMRYRHQAILFFAGWFLLGAAVATATLWEFVIASIGGVFDPPVVWTLARDIGSLVLPLLLSLGGIPAAVQIWRRRPWKMAALVSLATCALAWFVFVFLVLWAPGVFGWTW